MPNNQRYVNSTRKNFTDAELRKAQENHSYVANRFPEEFAESEALIKARGLGGHREITAHYLANKSPMDSHTIKLLQTYADSTYEGPFGRGRE